MVSVDVKHHVHSQYNVLYEKQDTLKDYQLNNQRELSPGARYLVSASLIKWYQVVYDSMNTTEFLQYTMLNKLISTRQNEQ